MVAENPVGAAILNPEIDAVRKLLGQLPVAAPVTEMRATYDAFGGLFPTPSDVAPRSEQVCGMAVEWTSTPDASLDRVVLYLHGGGYSVGSIASHRHLVAQLGRSARTQSLAVDYRLAPEHAFPAAVEDCVAGYRFLLEAGFAASSIAIAGDSAGGGLTMATLLAARDARLPQPACAVCLSPWVDLEANGASMATKAAEDPLVKREPLLQLAATYLGDADPCAPLAAPLYADLKGLAPLLIQVGSAEALLDDAVRLAAAAGAQEVEARLEVWPEMIHVWHFFHPVLADGRRALDTAGSYIRERMSR